MGGHRRGQKVAELSPGFLGSAEGPTFGSAPGTAICGICEGVRECWEVPLAYLLSAHGEGQPAGPCGAGRALQGWADSLPGFLQRRERAAQDPPGHSPPPQPTAPAAVWLLSGPHPAPCRVGLGPVLHPSHSLQPETSSPSSRSSSRFSEVTPPFHLPGSHLPTS